MRTAVDILASIGTDPETILAGIGLSSKKLISMEIIPSDIEGEFLERAALASGRKDLGLLVGKAINDHNTFGTVALFVADCENMLAVIEEGSRYLHLINSALSYSLIEGRDDYALRLNLASTDSQLMSQYREALQVINLRFLRTLLGDAWLPTKITFDHAKMSSAAIYRAYFSVLPEFKAKETALHALKHDFERHLSVRTSANEYIEPFLDGTAGEADQRLDLAEKVRSLVRTMLPVAPVTARAVAKALGMTPRTLQRHLSEHDTTVKKLVNEARQQMVKDFIPSGGATGNQLAQLLGFSEHSAASRFIRQHRGKSMSDLKAENKKPSQPK